MLEEVRELLTQCPELIDLEIEFWTNTTQNHQNERVVELKELKEQLVIQRE